MIIGIAGRKRSGKDTLGAELVTHLGFIRVGFADALKELTVEIFSLPTPVGGFTDGDWARLKELPMAFSAQGVPLTGRDILQRLGAGARKTLGEDVWVKEAMARCHAPEKNNYVFTDLRFPNEMAAVQKAGGKVIRLNRADHAEESFHYFMKPDTETMDLCYFLASHHLLCGLPLSSHPTIYPLDRHASETSLPDESNSLVRYDAVLTGTMKENTKKAVMRVKLWMGS
jgi:hypothetical protein